jgi:PAS domain S-box-containing protein
MSPAVTAGGDGSDHATVPAVPSGPDFVTLAEAMEVAVFIVRGTAILYVNPAAAHMVGYTREDLLEMRFWDFVHPDHQTIVRERGMARQREDVDLPRHVNYKLLTKAGVTVWVDFSGVLVDFEGRPAILGTAVDITAHKRLEEALRQSETRLRRLVDSHILGVIIGRFDGRLREVNQSILDMLGYTADAPPARWDQLTPPE